jgi:hypothetical protein
MKTPNKGEDRSAFIARCVSSEESKKDFPDNKQRVAFCYSQWGKTSKAEMEDDDDECEDMGKCPKCGAMGVKEDKGMTTCAKGCTYANSQRICGK